MWLASATGLSADERRELPDRANRHTPCRNGLTPPRRIRWLTDRQGDPCHHATTRVHHVARWSGGGLAGSGVRVAVESVSRRLSTDRRRAARKPRRTCDRTV